MRYKVFEAAGDDNLFNYYVCDIDNYKIMPNTGTNSLHRAINMCDSFNDMEDDKIYYAKTWREKIIDIHKENARVVSS